MDIKNRLQEEMTVTNNVDRLAKLMDKNLVLNRFVKNQSGQCYMRQSKTLTDLYADPLGMMLEERRKNVGELKFADTEDLNDELAEVTMLKEIEFPSEYHYLLSLNVLNEQTLRLNHHLWKTIMNKPKETKAIIEKEVALICLNWAQSKLSEKIPVIEKAMLKYSHQSEGKGQFGKMTTVVLELLSPNEMIARQVRKGAILKFMSLESGMMLDVPWAKVKAAKNRFIHVHVYVYNLKTKKSKELIERMSLLDNEQVKVFESQPDFIPQSMLRSIERIKTGTLNNIVNPDPETDLEDNAKNFKAPFKRLLPTLKAYTGLNTYQSQVLYSICTCSHRDTPYVLNGPPGTGKTRVIASTARCLLEMDPNIRILLTAPSNMAVDMIAHKVMDQFDGHTMHAGNVLRLKSIGLDFTNRDQKLDPISCFDSVAEIFKIPGARDFLRYRIVLSTLGCSTHIINKQLPPGFFTHIFLDEAGQANESEIWIPLGGLATEDTSVIFCGDPKQLGPVIALDLPQHVTNRFDSALVRYMSMSYYEYDERVFCQLTRSYRCHQTILDIASQLFYKEKLKSGILYRHEPFHQWKALPKRDFPVLFVSVDGNQFTEGNSKSFANKMEILVTMAYIERLITDYDIDPADIGVISPYRHQTHLLLQHLDKSGLPNTRKLTIDSVERFQGSERRVIIMTATRTRGLGFVGCDLRLNTSITRAMNLLIIIGNKEALSNHWSWARFIEYCDEQGSKIDWKGQVELFQ